jgi:hypothetical protein
MKLLRCKQRNLFSHSGRDGPGPCARLVHHDPDGVRAYLTEVRTPCPHAIQVLEYILMLWADHAFPEYLAFDFMCGLWQFCLVGLKDDSSQVALSAPPRVLRSSESVPLPDHTVRSPRIHPLCAVQKDGRMDSNEKMREFEKVTKFGE